MLPKPRPDRERKERLEMPAVFKSYEPVDGAFMRLSDGDKIIMVQEGVYKAGSGARLFLSVFGICLPLV